MPHKNADSLASASIFSLRGLFMETVRFGVIGLGNMGSHHAHYLGAGAVDGAKLGAVCDIDPVRLGQVGGKYGVPKFSNHREMLNSGTVDAIIIAVPHYDHAPIAMDAFAKNVHVISEKPVAVSVNAARKLNDDAARHPHLKFGVMFNQRTNGMYQKMREVIADGELGEITRITWLVTDWFRTWTYYASGGWRATWAGEGGGVLINQCPHNLDLIQWIPNMMPNRVTAVASIGKTHPIEVEDEVSAIFEYPSGAIGHFVTTTGEAPGTNRLEIAGDRGKIVAENGKIHFRRARHSVRKVRETSPLSFTSVETWDMEIPYKSGPAQEHQTMTQNFVNAVLKGTPMLGPGNEGVRGLEIGNAMLLAGVTRQPVDLPIDGEAYDAFIRELTTKYGGRKTLETKSTGPVDLAGSYSKA
jgi:predicted dehydrogenase